MPTRAENRAAPATGVPGSRGHVFAYHEKAGQIQKEQANRKR